jgi:hypothetical protein
MALVNRQHQRYSDAAEEVGNQRLRDCRSVLFGNGVGFRSRRKIVHSDQEVSVSLVTPWEETCSMDAYPLERDPDNVLIHLAPRPGSGAATGCTGVSPPAPLLLPGASSTITGPYSGPC